MAESTGLRTKFYRKGEPDPTTGTAVFKEIAQVASIQPPQPERDSVDVEELNPEGDVKKKLIGLIDAGEVEITLNFDPTNTGHLALEEDFRSGNKREYQIKLPSGYGWTFEAYVTAYQPQEITASDVIQVKATLLLAGNYTFGQITA